MFFRVVGRRLKITIETYQDYSAAYLLLGKTLEKLSNKEEAIETYKKGIVWYVRFK
jgi:tetratricopeptide (TPR) repeat protein